MPIESICYLNKDGTKTGAETPDASLRGWPMSAERSATTEPGGAFFKEGLGAIGHCRDQWCWEANRRRAASGIAAEAASERRIPQEGT